MLNDPLSEEIYSNVSISFDVQNWHTTLFPLFMTQIHIGKETGSLGKLDLSLMLIVNCVSPEFQFQTTAQCLIANIPTARQCLYTTYQQVRIQGIHGLCLVGAGNTLLSCNSLVCFCLWNGREIPGTTMYSSILNRWESDGITKKYFLCVVFNQV